MAAAAGNMLDLEALVAASRDAAMGGSETATDQLHLPQVASHAQHLLAAIQQHRRELRGGGSVTTPPVPAREDDPQLAEQQGELLLCFRIFRNAAAAGPCAAAALLSCGLLELAGSTLDLLASAAIPLNWQLPAALAQALANFCTASREAAAAAWSALFPLHLSMLAHVTAGKGRGLGQGRQRPWWRGRASRWSRNGVGRFACSLCRMGVGARLPHYRSCLMHRPAGSTQAATCLALLACCRVLEGASAALVGEQGSQLMTALLCNQQRMLHQVGRGKQGLAMCLLCFSVTVEPCTLDGPVSWVAHHYANTKAATPDMRANIVYNSPGLPRLARRGSTTTRWACWWRTSASSATSCPACSPRWVPARALVTARARPPAGQPWQPSLCSPPWRSRRCWACCARRRRRCCRPGGELEPPVPDQLPVRQSGTGRAACTACCACIQAAPQPQAQPHTTSPFPHTQHCTTCRQEGTARRGASMACLVELVQLLAGASRAAELTPGQQQVLQEALHLMRDVCARDDSGRGLAVAGGSSACIEQGPSPDLVAELQAAGAVPALLAMLKALEPIQNPQQQRVAADDGVAARDSSGGIRVAELAPLLAGAAARFPSAPPYPGFRSDLLAVLANAAHGRRCVQASGAWRGGGQCAAPTFHALPCCAAFGRCPESTAAVVPLRPTASRTRWDGWGAWSWCWRSASWTGSRRWHASGRSGQCGTCARATLRRRWAGSWGWVLGARICSQLQAQESRRWMIDVQGGAGKGWAASVVPQAVGAPLPMCAALQAVTPASCLPKTCLVLALLAARRRRSVSCSCAQLWRARSCSGWG